jgi:UDP-N-acetylmuramoyl-L-alanyl-D-glutamate--2,6-diaminopimelate ligase
MTVRELLAHMAVQETSSVPLDEPVAGLSHDSRRIGPGYLFFAFAGARADGRRFAQSAIEQGALAVVYEQQAPEGKTHPYIVVAHGRRALAAAARQFYGCPDESVQVIGFTGTNGKSTGTMLTDAILQSAGKRTSLINTIGYHLCGTPLPAVNTTPESLEIYRLLRETLDRGGECLTMEVSSHALALGRVEYLRFAVAVFTNLTRDHLDFHGTMEAYFAAKARLFGEDFHPAVAVLNADDAYSPRIALAAGTRRITYGTAPGATIRAVDIASGFEGLEFRIEGGPAVRSRLVGDINVYNILAAAGACRGLDMDWDRIVSGIASFRGVPGRFERVEAGQPFLVVVDYAHTDAAITNVIRIARQLAGANGRVLTLFGCGGDRDRTKRPLMGAAAARDSDFVVLTSDNPRSEDPLAIIHDAAIGARGYDTPLHVEPDRAAAISAILQAARSGDVVLLTGKGHEDYQVLADRTIPFSDRDVALRALHALGFHGSAE